MAAISPHVNGDLQEVDDDWRDSQVALLSERLAELEFAQEDQGWLRLSGEGDSDFSREGLRDITSQARLYFLKHPLINRAVTIQSQYVFAQGLSVVAQDQRIQDVLNAFMDDPKNQVELTAHQARTMKEQELAVTGNLFFAFFVNPSSGRVRVRSIPFSEVADIYFNPEDRKEPWYYRRSWTEYAIPEAGSSPTPQGTARSAWYPDWRHTSKHPATLGGVEVRDVPVYHVKVGGLPDMKFGVSEVYQALDWARAYKEFLTDFATLVKALSRFAWKSTVKGGVAARTAATAKLSRQPASAAEPQVNRTTAGATFVSSEPGANLDPIPKTGTTIPVEEGRRLLLMVAAATGLPETFFGDVSVGTLATATSLDRPTELKFADRQALWRDVHVDLLDYVIDRAIEATNGSLEGNFAKAEDGEEGEGRWVLAPPEEVPPGQEMPEEGDRAFAVNFPPILAHDLAANVAAAVSAVTLNGSALATELITPEQASRILLQSLGVEDVDEWLAEVFPVDDEGNPVLRPDQILKQETALAIAKATAPTRGHTLPAEGPPEEGTAQAQEALAEAIRELIQAVEESKL